MRRTLYSLLTIVMTLMASTGHASLQSKTWPASDEAKQFVIDTVVIGFLASPYGAGWTENQQLLDYFEESRNAGITGHDACSGCSRIGSDLVDLDSGVPIRSCETKLPFHSTTVLLPAAFVRLPTKSPAGGLGILRVRPVILGD